MKLAIVTSYPPSKVTLNEYAFHLVKNLRQTKDITEIVLLTDKTDVKKDLQFEKDGCKITLKECWSYNSYKNIINVTRAIDQTKPDAVLFNLHFLKFGNKKIPAALGLMLPLICKIKNIPSVVLLHNIVELVDLESTGFAKSKLKQKVYRFMGSIVTRLILRADIVAVTLKKYADVLEAKYNAKNVKLIPHGTFEIIEEPGFNMPFKPFRVLAFGKFGTYKRVEALIEAVEKIRKYSNLKIEVIIAGTDNPDTPGYLDSVKQAYSDVEGITFMGYVKEKNISKLFNESSVVVLPYTSLTGSSGVLHQAGSYGKAVVIPELADLKQVVHEEGYRGEFFEPNSVISLALAIQKILEDNVYRVELEKANYKAATNYPMSKIANMYLTAFQSAILERKKREISQGNQAVA